MYTCNKVAIPAAYPRQIGSTIFDEKLKLCYRKHAATHDTIKNKKVLVNLVFLHGNGMTKGIWRYHIEKLYNLYNSTSNTSTLGIGTVLSPDMVNHGDSASLNQRNIGAEMFDWLDGARDVVEMVKFEHESFNHVGFKNLNIIVGHSMGGFMALMTQYFHPGLFHAVVPLNPVMYNPDIEGYAQASTAIFKEWNDRGYMEDKFKVGQSNRFEAYDEFFNKRSFYKRFHPKVLQYMLEDDTYQEGELLEARGDTDHIYMKTTVKNQLITYCSGSSSIPIGMKLYHKIQVPVYYILSAQDYTLDAAREYLEEQLSHVISRISCKGYHIVNGEDPDTFVKLIEGIIRERADEDGPKIEVVRPSTVEIDPVQVERERRQKLMLDKFEKRTTLKL